MTETGKRERRAVEGWVYFFRGHASGLFKIGCANDPERRFFQIQTGCPEELWIPGVLASPDPRALETALHRRFAKYRTRGEWFEDREEEIDWFIERYCYELGGRVRVWDELNGMERRPYPQPAIRHLIATPPGAMTQRERRADA